MKIEKGQLLKIEHRRKGVFVAEALRDFDSEKVFSFPVALAEGYVSGLSDGWEPGEMIPCRASFARILEVL